MKAVEGKRHTKSEKVTDIFVSLTEGNDRERRGTKMRKLHRDVPLVFDGRDTDRRWGRWGGGIEDERMGELCLEQTPWLLFYSLSC